MAKDKGVRAPFKLGGVEIAAGERRKVDIPISMLANHTGMKLTVEVIHGRQEGPALFVSGAVHGDEIIGVEIIRRLAQSRSLKKVAGTLLLIPIVNGYGFIANSRYLPDRRDLNRSFPGAANGSLASQLANTFMTQIVEPCDCGVDLHSGAVHRANLPQIRAQIADKNVKALAAAFGAPVIVNANLREGSLREAAQKKGCAMLLYEAGEALRFDEKAVRIGVKGVFQVMRHLNMLEPLKSKDKRAVKPFFSQSSHWLRAPAGGIVRSYVKLGEHVREGEKLAIVSGPFGDNEQKIVARSEGIVIGRSNLPVVNRGDALFHVANVFDPDAAGARIEKLGQEIVDDPLFDDAGVI